MGYVLVLLTVSFFAQLNPAVDGPALTPPGGSGPVVQTPGGSTTQEHTTTNVTNVYPAPSEELMTSTISHAAPLVIDSSMRSVNTGAASSMRDLFSLVDGLDHLRHDVIFSQTVLDINTNMARVVTLLMGLVIAAICLWGIIGQALGSDGTEALHVLGAVPMWSLLALTTVQWFRVMMDAFTAIALAVTNAAQGSFGRVMTNDFWANTGLSLFALIVGFFLLLVILFFVLELFSITAFLGFALAFAPIFVFAKSNRWTEHWGNNWFRMVPGAAMDLVCMVGVLTIGAVAMQRVGSEDAGSTIAFLFGILLALPLIKRLCGLEHAGGGTRVAGAFFLARYLRAARSGGRKAAPTPTPAPATEEAGTSAATRAPRWNIPQNTYATTRKGYQSSRATWRYIATP